MGEGLDLADLSRVEIVQTYDGNTTSPLVFSYPNNSSEKKTWARDVCGWLSRPASDEQGNVISPHGNFALVKSFNGSLFDRKFGDANMAGDENRDLAFGYILEVVPEMIDGGKGCRLRLKFSWPLLEEDYIGIRSGAVTLKSRSGKLPRKKEWELRMPGKQIVPVLWRCDLNLRERLFMEKMSDRYYSRAPLKPNDMSENFDIFESYLFQYTSQQIVQELVGYKGPKEPGVWLDRAVTRIFTGGHLGMYLINNNGDPLTIASIQRPNNQRPYGYVRFGGVEVPTVRGLGSRGISSEATP